MLARVRQRVLVTAYFFPPATQLLHNTNEVFLNKKWGFPKIGDP